MKTIIIVSVLSTLAVTALFVGGPKYNVYISEMQGKAKLAEAEFSKQVLVQEAKAKLESAKFLNEAEVERAKGVAAANKIIGDSLSGNEDYLRYLWIQNLENSKDQVIYIPTEAGLPILESQRLSKPVTSQTPE